jgi:hypothetical protein
MTKGGGKLGGFGVFGQMMDSIGDALLIVAAGAEP